MFGFANPWMLLLLPLALAPLFVHGGRRIVHPWLDLIPVDRWSRLAEWGVRLLGALVIALLILGLAGLYLGGRTVEQTVEGAQVVVVLDRSRSMNDSFAGESPEATGEESKAQAASRLLLDFVNERPENVYGVVEFSTSPIYVMPLTTKREAVRAALRASGQEGLALTAMAGALGMSANFFEGREDIGSRVILLVSDGAAALDPRAADLIRQWFADYDLRLYWIYMRTEGSPGIEPQQDQIDVVGGVPEQELHEYFQSLGVPYRAYEADNPAAVQRAVEDIDDLERLPLTTSVRLPQQDLTFASFGAGFMLLLVLIAARLAEVRVWRV